MRYCVCAALLRGSVLPSSFEPDAISDPAVQRLVAATSGDPYPLPPGAGDMSPAAPATVEVELADGRVLSETVADVPGSRDSPLSDEAVCRKYRECGGPVVPVRR